MDEKTNERTEELLYEFTINALIYSHVFLENLVIMENDELIEILKLLEAKINDNVNEKIYSETIKDNLYYIFSFYREKFKDENVLNKINELMTILRTSSDENRLKFLKAEYIVRYGPLAKIEKIDKKKLERLIYESISNDYLFLHQLVNDNTDYFVMSNLCSELSFSNLNYLLYLHPDILKDESLKTKIVKLLKMNMETVEEKLKLNGEMGFYREYKCSKKLGKASKKLKKEIKEYTK